MEPSGIGMAGLGIAGLSTLGAFGLAFRQRRRRLGAGAAAPGTGEPRGAADRLEALGRAQAELGLRLDALAAEARAPEERLQAMAGQLVGLIRDKNATLETALAGLDQLRARMRALEQMGEPAEARALVDGLGARLDALGAAQAGLEARLAALAEAGSSGGSALAERLAGLEEKRAAGLEATLSRLAPFEARLAALEGARDAEAAAGREALKRLEARLEAQGAEAGAARSELAALKAEAGAVRGLGEQLTRVLAQKEALAGTLVARVAAVEAALGEKDPAPALARLAERLAALETAENPFAEISEQLTRLYAQKDATVETVFARLAPLEAKLAELDPATALDRFAARLEGFGDRLAAIEENPFADLSERLARLYAQKDATVETVFARLAPLEAKLAELAQGLDRLAPLAADDPRAALDGLAVRLEALHWAQGETAAGLAALRAAAEARDGEDGALAAIADRLTRLFAQKDAGLAAILARLGPLEARLAAEAARAEARAAAETIAAEAATALFADRIAGLEARLPRVEPPHAPAAAGAAELEAILALPGLVSLHRRAPAAGGR